MATYWITTHALSAGIKKREFSDAAISARDKYIWDGWQSHTIGSDAFDNEADAKADAEKRRNKKIESLRKQIAKLEKLTF